DEHLYAGDPFPYLGHAVEREPTVYRAVAAPEDHRGPLELLVGQPAARLVRVVQHAVVQRQAQLEDGRVAPEVLVGKEKHLPGTPGCAGAWWARQRPFEGPPGVGGGADHATGTADEALDVGRGVHVRDGYRPRGDPDLGQPLPRGLHLREDGHVGHRAARREVRQDHLLRIAGQDVGALGHEVHTAEDDVLRA